MTSTERKTRTFRLTNSFHGSETRVRVPAGAVEDVDPSYGNAVLVTISHAQYRRADSALCGIKECRCGGIARDHSCQPTSGDFDRCNFQVFVPAHNEE